MIIYCIINMKNSKKYVGVTKKNKNARFSQHRYQAQKGSNLHLHQAMRKYGTDQFIVDILEEVTDENKNLREQYWIQTLNTFKKGYNMTLGGEGTHGVKRDLFGINNPMYGKKHSKTAIEKNRKSNLEYVLKNGSRKHDDETKLLISEKKRKNWIIIDSEGNTEKISNLWQYCKTKNLDACHLYKVASGKLKQHKGYKCYEAN